MGSWLRHSSRREILDEPGRVPPKEMAGCLAGLERVNRFLGGRRALLRGVMPLLREAARRRSGTVRVCDVGTGAADLPLVVAAACGAERLDVHITAVESNPILAAEARRRARGIPQVSVLCDDARRILADSAASLARPGPTAEGSPNALACPEPFDVVTCSLFLHHFPAREASDWIGLMDAAARVGWVVNDLERHLLALLGIHAVGPLLCRNRVFANDAPLSVRRAWTPEEWRDIARAGCARDVAVERCWAFRVLISSRSAVPRRRKKLMRRA